MISRHQNVIISILVALGIVLSGYFVSRGAQRFGGDNKTITVRGIGQREIKASQGFWQIEFLVSEPTLEAATRGFKKNNEIIKEFLKKHHFLDAEVSIGVPTVRFVTEEFRQNNGNPKVNLEGVVYVSSENVDKMQEAFGGMAQLFEKGVIL